MSQNRMKTGVCLSERSNVVPKSWNLNKLFRKDFLRKYVPAGADTFRFSSLYDSCLTDEVSKDPFGVDPVFLPAAEMYDVELKVADYYNSSDDKMNGAGLPHAFRYFEVNGNSFSGFNAYLDINVKNDRAKKILQYLQQGKHEKKP